MSTWTEFETQAPRIAEIFRRRHAATGALCLLGTLRSDGFPRISPMEPHVFEGELWLVGMAGTTKFRDLDRDGRLCLHTATVDTQVSDGDAKLFGVARRERDTALHARFAQDLFSRTGFDLRGEPLEEFWTADWTGASSVEVVGDHLDITIWTPGAGERVERKH